MKKEATSHHMDGVYVLLLFAVFAGCILIVLLFGASAYEKLVERDQAAYNQRTGIQYLAAKVRHSDSADHIFVGSFSDRTDASADDIDTLYLQFVGDEGDIPGFYTQIYYYDGYIREVLCAEDSGLFPEDGSKIMAADGLEISKSGNLISCIVINEDGSESSLKLAVRSGGNKQ